MFSKWIFRIQILENEVPDVHPLKHFTIPKRCQRVEWNRIESLRHLRAFSKAIPSSFTVDNLIHVP